MESESFQVVCDNIVTDSDGMARIHETMFSGMFDLTNDRGEILLRLHPLKKMFFDSVSHGTAPLVTSRDYPSKGQSTELKFNSNIEIHVNNPSGGTEDVAYTTLSGVQSKSISKEIQLQGFDENAEPVIRLLQDGSLRLIFCTMPPSRHCLGNAFNMDDFGTKLQKAISAKIEWDDRDVFLARRADTNTVTELLDFIRSYGQKARHGTEPLPSGKPWWKVW
jgi:hypothetical protein